MRLAAAYLVLPVVAVAAGAHRDWLDARYWLAPHEVDVSETRRDVELLARPGRVLCEDLALCLWAGKTAEVDFFGTQQAIRHGGPEADTLAGDVENGRFSAIQTDVPTRPLGPRFAAALDGAYRVAHETPTRRVWVAR